MTDDLKRWLAALDLAKYAEAFAENEVQFGDLAELTETDLKEMGLPIGPRRRALKAIAEQRAATRAPPLQADPTARERPAVSSGVERRQLTVVFCDLVDSTKLSHRLDPEDLREVMRRYQDAVAGAISRYEGFVAKFLGDGVLAYFGWPRALEDQAERAVRAAMDAVAAVADLKFDDDLRLQSRVGVATGQVVVGDIVGESATETDAVFGETPNLAARLESVAHAESVVVSETTRQLIADLFDLEDLGPHELKGFSEPVAAWRVKGESPDVDRFKALHGTGLTHFVGREQEVALLMESWERAKSGEGQVVLVSGEAGIGKSRLTQALRERLAEESHTRIRCQCSPYHTKSALTPVIHHLEYAARFSREDLPQDKLTKLEALLAQSSTVETEAASLLAALLSIPFGERYPAPDMTPQRQKERTLEVLVDQMVGLTEREPVLFILEDAHWIDPTTEELIQLILRHMKELRLLFVATFRAEYTPPWSTDSHVSRLNLGRLSDRHCEAMVSDILANRSVPSETLDQIVRKTDGVPLFVEELSKSVLELGILETGLEYASLSNQTRPLAIPATLRDSLMSRLDRLETAKDVATLAATLGRSFRYEILAEVSTLQDGELQQALSRLVDAELLYRRGAPPEESYEFKHALIQDTAYQSLLKADRQRHHRRIAEVLTAKFPKIAETEPELIAFHFAEAGDTIQSIEYLYRAGQRAIQRSANVEALAHLRDGLELLDQLPKSSERDQRELAFQIARGPVLIGLRGYGAPETGRCYARARELCEALGETSKRFPILYGINVHHTNRAELRVARDAAQELHRLAEQERDTGALVIAHRLLGISSFYLGDFAAARGELERALALHDPHEHADLAFTYTHDPQVTVRCFLSLTLLVLGYLEHAESECHRALDLARDLDHPHTLIYALNAATGFHQLCRKPAEVRRLAEELESRTIELGFPHWSARSAIFRGWALAETSDSLRGLELLAQGTSSYRAAGSLYWLPYFSALTAEALLHSDRSHEARDYCEEALARVQSTEERWYEAELHRLRGRICRSRPDKDRGKAEACLEQAIALARDQGARLWELRAATDLARLWYDRNRRAEARRVLEPVYGRFTEGFGSTDLQEAATLMECLT